MGLNFRMNLILGFLGLSLLNRLLLCKGDVHYYDFVLQETNYTRLCSTKSILTVNGSFPGPTISIRKGDTVFVNVHNQGLYGVTIHWHGVKQPRNPWHDGPEYVTQCPIKAGTNFTYEVFFSDEEGTLWWHAHSDWSRATVHGAIIILPAVGSSYPYTTPDAQETIILGSWFKGDLKAIPEEALATGGDPDLQDAYTINGQPGDLYACSKETTYRLAVDYGKTYLLRIINGVMNVENFFGIAGHSLTVVGTDGAYTKPIVTDYIMITPGQTVDVLVTMNQSLSYYYIAATPFADTVAPFDNTTTTAILQYNGEYAAPSSIPLPKLPSYNDKDAAESFINSLRSLASTEHPINVPTNITRRIYMTVSMNQIACPDSPCSGPNGNRFSASLNNITFATPSISILQAYYKRLSGVYTTDFPEEPPYFFNFTGDVGNNTLSPAAGTKVIMLSYGEAVEMVFQGTNVADAPENHPMHLHGFSFYMIGTGSGNFDKETDPKNFNLVDPPEVNSIGVPKNGWAAIRFVANNPGVWFMHCHLEIHVTWGMGMVFIVTNGPTRDTSMRQPPAYMPPCSET
ncbi:hypothetical protein I3843_15G008100 [Carya illinoinensis]|nr:hypothetical protein I3843_15G008100 [Carya illinoinensis]